MTTVHFNATEATLDHLLDIWKDNPKRKGAVSDIKRIKTQFELEREIHAAPAKTVLRPDYVVRRTADIAFTKPANKKLGRIRTWLINTFGVGIVLGCLWAVSAFAAAFNPLYGTL